MPADALATSAEDTTVSIDRILSIVRATPLDREGGEARDQASTAWVALQFSDGTETTLTKRQPSGKLEELPHDPFEGGHPDDDSYEWPGIGWVGNPVRCADQDAERW